MQDELEQVHDFTIPFKKEQETALLGGHVLYSAIYFEQEREKGSSTAEFVQKTSVIMDKIKDADTSGSFTLDFKEVR